MIMLCFVLSGSSSRFSRNQPLDANGNSVVTVELKTNNASAKQQKRHAPKEYKT